MGRDRHERGYGYAWEVIRARIMRRDKALCQHCLRAGRVVPATDVDHIIAKKHGGTDSDDNLEALCKPCHKKKTAKERTKKR